MVEYIARTENEIDTQNSFQDTLSSYLEEVVVAMRMISDMGEKRRSNLLLQLGSAIMMVALFMMLQSSGVGISNISISEIIAISIVSVVLVLAGSYLCLYQYKEQQEINRQVRKAGLDILHRIITHEKQMAIKGM